MAQLKKWIIRNRVIICTAALSIAVFIFLYGFRVLDVTNTDWLMAGGDLSQHYLGWQFFRFAPWQFQIGMMNTIAYPYNESVIFTDSIPLFSVLFKIFRGILPEEFQFFGLWGVFCFVLQGMLAVRILGNFLRRESEIFIGSVFFVLTPVFIDRMFWHSALAAHFLILFAILLFVEEEKTDTPVKSAVCWGACGMLAAAVHLYFLAMCGAVLAGFAFCRCLKKKWQDGAAALGAYLFAAAATVWILGGFSSGMDDGAPGLGYYSFNLNSFLNGRGWSSLFPELPCYADGQYEGFAYLGAGILCLTVTAFVVHRKQQKRFSAKAAGAVLTSAALIFAAASNEVSLGNRLLFRYPVPEWLEELWAPFRSSGRLVWPVVYFIMIYGICGVRKSRKKYLWSSVLFGCLVLQLVDTAPGFLEKHREFSEEKKYQESVDTKPLLSVCAERKIRHLIFMEKDKMPQEDLYTFSNFAWKKGITINDFYFARNLSSPTKEVAHDFALHPAEDCIYLFGEEDRMRLVSYDLHYYRVGKYYAGLKDAAAGLPEVQADAAADFSYVFAGEHVDGGYDEAGVRYLSPQGSSFGPYLALPKGSYSVVVYGTGLLEAGLESYSSGGGKIHEPENLYKNDELMQYEFSLDENVEDYEIKITNLSDTIMKISGICVRRTSDLL